MLAAETGAKVTALNIQRPFIPPVFAEMPIAAPYADSEYEKAVARVSARVLSADSGALGHGDPPFRSASLREFPAVPAVIRPRQCGCGVGPEVTLGAGRSAPWGDWADVDGHGRLRSG